MVTLIGDVHGKYGEYKQIIKRHKNSIALGDMGLGFFRFDHHEGKIPMANPPYDYMVKYNARFIRGNHDNPEVCKKHTQWIPDGTIEGDMFFLGGAFSIDHMYRLEGYSWWKDEELSHEEFDKIIDPYRKAKPRIVITHDCPLRMVPYVGSHHIRDNSRTQQFLQSLFEFHQPEYWYFGHHHKSWKMISDKTTFRCLAELETLEI